MSLAYVRDLNANAETISSKAHIRWLVVESNSKCACVIEDGSLQLVGCRRYCNVLNGVTVHDLVDVHGWNVSKINQLWLFLQVNPRSVVEQNYGNSMHSPLLMAKV